MQDAIREYMGATIKISFTEVEMAMWKKANRPRLKTFLGHEIKPNENFYRISAYKIGPRDIFFGSILMVESEAKQIADLFWNSGIKNFIIDKHTSGLHIDYDFMQINSKEFIDEHKNKLKEQERISNGLIIFNAYGGINYHHIHRRPLNYYRINGYFYKKKRKFLKGTNT